MFPVNIKSVYIYAYNCLNETLKVSSDGTNFVEVAECDKLLYLDKTITFDASQQAITAKYVRLEPYRKYLDGRPLTLYDIIITTTSGEEIRTNFTKDEVASGNWCQKYYSEESDKSDLGQWRIPNEKELNFMNNWVKNLEAYTAGRSKYYRKKDNLDMIYYKDPEEGTSSLTTHYADDRLGKVMKLRCVRDTQGTTSKTYDSSFSNGGSGLGQ